MSMIGLAASPGTDVEPACSRTTTSSPRVSRIRAASRPYSAGQPGSYSCSPIGALCGTTSPTTMAPSSSSDSTTRGYVVSGRDLSRQVRRIPPGYGSRPDEGALDADVDHRGDAPEHLVRVADAVDHDESALAVVELDQRLGLRLIQVEPAVDRI